MNKCRKSCIIPTPVHIGDAMFIGSVKDNDKKKPLKGPEPRTAPRQEDNEKL